MPFVFPGLAEEVGAICSRFGLRDVYTGMTNIYNQPMVEPFRKMQSMPLKQVGLGPEGGPIKESHKVGTQLFPVINGLNHPSICPTSKCHHPSFACCKFARQKSNVHRARHRDLQPGRLHGA